MAKRKEGKTTSVFIVVVNLLITETYTVYSDQLTDKWLKMYVNAMGLRGISRVKKLHHTTIINLIKQAGKLLPRSYSPQETPQVGELDELQT